MTAFETNAKGKRPLEVVLSDPEGSEIKIDQVSNSLDSFYQTSF